MEVSESTDPAVPLLLREASSIVIGTVVCGSVIAAAAGQQPSVSALCGAIVGTITVYWLAGVYAATLATAVQRGHALWRAALGIARRSWHVPMTSLLPVGILVLASLLGAEIATAATIALSLTVAVLAVYGYLAGRAAGLSASGRVWSGLVGAALGLGILLLKSLVSH